MRSVDNLPPDNRIWLQLPLCRQLVVCQAIAVTDYTHLYLPITLAKLLLVRYCSKGTVATVAVIAVFNATHSATIHPIVFHHSSYHEELSSYRDRLCRRELNIKYTGGDSDSTPSPGSSVNAQTSDPSSLPP
ncbi:hypothetical protein QAD02_000019 [Eretmocerus hayati]|uniref:Uncharacterized protein n=1 Tax=Eretmocerus hayati TaxID=131215 RepID=A0ACC2NGP7_9HYME|nr:hypothetical protein QAD02_000019 [Eretmocerus hayati]